MMKWAKVCGIVASVFAILFLFCAALQSAAMDRHFFYAEFEKLQVSEETGMSPAELEKVTDNLLSYLEGNRETLDMTAVIKGQQREVFNQKEKDHMVDVKALFVLLQQAKITALGCSIALLAVTVLLSRKKALHTITRSYLWAAVGFFGAVLVLGIIAAVNFSFFWTNFHQLFFTNDLWILDPATDVLIRMMPSKLFLDIVTRILTRFAAAILLLAAVSAGYLLVKRKKRNSKGVK
ncbi:MAG: TIGR01906 family membrane protein [Christensenellales bacterium]